MGILGFVPPWSLGRSIYGIVGLVTVQYRCYDLTNITFIMAIIIAFI